jgi:hypothetical protein
MSYRNPPDDLVLQVSPAEVRRYAIAEGWWVDEPRRTG